MLFGSISPETVGLHPVISLYGRWPEGAEPPQAVSLLPAGILPYGRWLAGAEPPQAVSLLPAGILPYAWWLAGAETA